MRRGVARPQEPSLVLLHDAIERRHPLVLDFSVFTVESRPDIAASDRPANAVFAKRVI